jgi:two-component system sensor histidine kinase/response regulator
MKAWIDLLERQPLRLKLAIGLVSGLLVAIIIGGYSLYVQARLAGDILSLYQHQLQGVAHAKEAQLAFSNVGRVARLIVFDTAPGQRGAIAERLAAVEAVLQREIAATRASITPGSPNLQNLAAFEAAYKQYRTNLDHFFALAEQDTKNGIHDFQAGKATAFLLSAQFQGPRDAANEALTAFARVKVDSALAAARNAEHLNASSRAVMLALLLGGMSLAIGVTYLASRSIRRPLNRLRDTVEQLALGKLALKVPHTQMPNEVGDLARSIAALQEEARQMAGQRWIKTQMANLGPRLQSAADIEAMGLQFLSFHGALGWIAQGGFWLPESDGQFRLAGSWPDADSGDELAGLVQRCAEGRLPVEESSGAAMLLALPALLHGKVKAVATFELVGETDASLRALLEEAMPMLAANLEIMESSKLTLKTKAWFRAILESAPDGMLVADEAGKIILANPRIEAMFGYQTGELMGQSVDLLVPAAIRGRHPAMRASYVADGATRQMGGKMSDLLGVRKDGSQFAIDVGLSRLRALEGDGYSVCATVRDITERKHMESQMRRANFLADIALELTHCGYWHVDYSDPDYYYQSERAADILGEPARQDGRYHLQDEWFARLVEADPAIAAQTAERYQGAVDGKYDAYAATYAYKRPLDGRIVWVRAAGKLMHDEHGKLLFMYGAYQDITAQVEAEQALEMSAQRLNFALHGGKLGLWDWDVSTGRNEVNDIWAGMLGYTLDELNQDGHAADALARLLHPDDSVAMLAQFTRCIEHPDQPDFHALFRMQAKSGDWRWILSMGRATERDQAGRALRFVGIHQDVTERQQLQDEMGKARTVAEDATRAKSDFLANMSHEIRTPMNAIIGMSYLALQTQLDKRQRNYVEKVHRAAESLLGIINDILDFSKIEAGKMTMEAIDFYLEDVLETFTSMVGIKAEEKGLELLLDIAPDVPTALVGDPLRLGQILVNLGSNAAKFTEHGEILVRVEVAENRDECIDLHFSVHDSGIGMTPDQLNKLFRSFSQADASTTRKYGGTGLGLAISKHLVELMAGRIWVNSHPGEGTTFHFQASFGVQAVSQRRRMFRAEELAGLRVLVVDDNAAAREVLSTLARGFGLEVDVGANGKDALHLVELALRDGLPYDLLLLDWKMPGLDGVQTMGELERRHPGRAPAVIMVTAFGREEASSAAHQAGVKPCAMLTKPVTVSTLLETIGEALGKGVVAETRHAERESGQDEAIARLKGARILLVEDNRLNQELARELLEKAGIAVELAENGQEALDALALDADYDLVLMDCQMPVMDGYEATRAIRAQPELAGLTVIAMTANAMAGDREKVLEAGMQDHIPKPLRVHDMYATIAKWLRPGARAPFLEQPDVVASDGAPADLPGIDIHAGLQTAASDPRLYRKLLAMYVEDHGDFGSQFAQASATGKTEETVRLAHTLKGTSGNIGAFTVAAAARVLESLCAEQADDAAIAAAVRSTVAALDDVLPALRLLQKQAAPAGTGGHPADPEWDSKITSLRQLLADSDTAAMDLANELADSATSPEANARLKRVAAALDRFNFEEALQQMMEI